MTTSGDPKPQGGSSLWDLTTARSPFPALTSPFQTDVLVVGAGITGLTLALLLRREGRSVAVLEAEGVGSGATGGTSAHVTCIPDIRLARLVDRLGAAAATTYMKSAREALSLVQTLAEGAAGPCDWATVPAYLFAESAEHEGDLEREVDAARTLGLRASRAARTPLPFPVAGAVVYPDQGRFHPMKYLNGLARAVRDAGGQVFEHSRARSFEEVGGKVELETERGSVRAGHLVLATHTPLGPSLARAELVAYSSYLAALRLREAVPDALFWDTSQPYHYLRRFPGENEELLVLGGEDHRAAHPPEGGFDPHRRLEDYARARFSVEGVVHRWSARYYESADGLPYVGRSLLAEEVFIATGYSGNGLVQGTLAARILTDRLQGRQTTVGDLLAVTRVGPPGATG